MRTSSRIAVLAGAALCAICARGAEASAAGVEGAVLRLLNSRAAGSVRGYSEAAAEVAEEARRGGIVHGYLLALVSRDPDAPKEAHLDSATRSNYFARCRGPIERLAREGDNALAWYLLSLENGDTNKLHRAALRGNMQAANAWGSHVFSQAMVDGLPPDELDKVMAEAYGFFKAAAGKGDANGLYNMGMCAWRGLGTPRDEQTAFICFRAAAEKGHPEAINNIGAFFRDGVVVERDLELATKWFAKSASYENPYGQFNYALALRRGEGVAEDFAKAASLLEKAAAGGCVEAMNVFGVVLWKGEGVKADHERAFRLFMCAAETGYPPAMENVSTCYERGVGVKASERLSLEWKIRSRAAQGDRAAQDWLRREAESRRAGGGR